MVVAVIFLVFHNFISRYFISILSCSSFSPVFTASSRKESRNQNRIRQPVPRILLVLKKFRNGFPHHACVFALLDSTPLSNGWFLKQIQVWNQVAKYLQGHDNQRINVTLKGISHVFSKCTFLAWSVFHPLAHCCVPAGFFSRTASGKSSPFPVGKIYFLLEG